MSEPFPSDQLPDTFLVDVMSRQSLQDLAQLGLVSPRWLYLSAIALRRITRLAVLIGPNSICQANECYKLRYVEYIQVGRTAQERAQLLGLLWIDPQATLTYDNFGHEHLQWLTVSLPNIRHLTIVQDCRDIDVTDAVGQLTTMVNHWGNGLASLAIYSNGEGISPEHGNRLFALINGLTGLQDLSLKLSGDWHNVLDLSILARLRRLVFYSGGDPVANLLPSLRRYASVNESLEQIHLGNYVYPYTPQFLDLDQRVTSKITGLNQENWSDPHEEDLPVLCVKFRSLTYLYLQVEEHTARDLVHSLASLPQLHYLRLNLCDAALWFISIEADHTQDYSNQQSEGAQLTSVQVLSLTMTYSANHQDLARMFNFPYTFPSIRAVEVNELAWFGCGRCHIEDRSEICRPRHCTQQLLLSFRSCPQVRKIVHDGVEWSPNEL